MSGAVGRLARQPVGRFNRHTGTLGNQQTVRKGVTFVAEKVAKVGVKKQPGYLYFVDRQGDISRAKMARGGQRRRRSRR